MGQEVDLLVNYPRTPRDPKARAAEKTEADRALARQFGQAFFDGERRHGYGGFRYLERFWTPVVPTFQAHYGLKAGMSLLDVGCAKGFMLHDFARLIPGLAVAGIDISEYAIANSLDSVKPCLQVGNATQLPYADGQFDLVISINTVHNLERDQCIQALAEIQRVSKGAAYITVDAFRDAEEEQRMWDWNLTAKTILHVDEWRALFAKAGYRGDYYWFIP